MRGSVNETLGQDRNLALDSGGGELNSDVLSLHRGNNICALSRLEDQIILIDGVSDNLLRRCRQFGAEGVGAGSFSKSQRGEWGDVGFPF